MMGLGSFSNGGSSSSSNLSASAPPFMVDQSISKPNSNPLVNFSEALYGSGAYISSLPGWVPSLSPSSRPDFYANPTQEIDSIPSPKFDRYLVPPAVNSPNAPMPPLNSVTMDATGGFSFGQFKDSLKMGVVEARPYYPSYVSSALHEDNPLVALNEPAYDFLSTSHVAPLTGISQGDYSQSLSKLESSTRWDGSWNASIDLESGGQTDSHWSFFSKLANSPTYKDYDVPGVGASKVLSSFEESSAVSHSMNELGRENQVGSLGVAQLDGKSFASKDYKFIPFKSSTSGSVLGLGSGSSLLSPNIHSCTTSIDSIANSNSLSSQKLDNVEYEQCFRQRDMRLDNFSSVSKSSAVVGNTLPPVEVSSSALNTISFENVNYIATAVADKSEDSACNSLSNVNDHHLTLSFEGKEACANPSRLGLFLESYNYHVADAFSTTKEELSSNKFVTTNAFDHLSKPTSKLQFGQTRNPDGFSLVFDDTKAADSAENQSKTIDQYNPAEDSPCWKGASASHFFPFEVPEAHTPQHLMENSEPSNVLSLEPQIYPLNSDDLISVKFRKSTEYNENGPSRNGLSSSVVTPSVATYSYGEQGSDNSLKSPEQSSDGVQLPNSFYEDRKENALMENSTIDADNRHSLTDITAPSLRKVKFPSERKCGPGTCAGDTGMIINDALEYGSSHAPIHNTKEISFSDTVEDTPAQRVKSRNEVSTSKIDVQMLIKTMQNLSNLLLFYGSNDVCGLSEEDNETLQNVIKNLEAYIFKNAEQMAPRRESEFSQQGTSHFLKKESPKLQEGARVDRANATKVAVADAIDELGHQLVPKDNKHNIVPRKKDEIFQDLVFARNDVETVKTDSMTQAIKKLLSENFHDGGELEPEASLYKNLWLEAEAAICSMSYRARYNRTKIEMDKFKHKEAEESSIDEGKLSKSRVYPDLTTVNKLASESKYGVQGSHIISSTGHSDAVLMRFHILKYRVDNSPSLNAADSEQLSCNASPDFNMTETLETHANDSLTSDIAAMGSPISSKSTYTDEIEDSVMARFRILKRRFDNSSSADMGGQQLPEVADLGFVGRRSLPSTSECIQDGTFNQLQHHSEDCTEEESKLCEGGDMIIQSCGTDKLRNQLPAGWYDTSSFDWEHVVKDDFVPPK